VASPENPEPVEEWDGKRMRTAYTARLEENLFEPLANDARSDFEAGDGGELRGNMRALYSSSAMACNLFHHLRRPDHRGCLLEAMDRPRSSVASISFEQKRKVMENPKSRGFSRDPNLDVVIAFSSSGKTEEIAVECKFREPWSGRPEGLKAKYLETSELWGDLKHLNDYARTIGAGKQDQINQHLHAAQLIKHLLGLHYANRVSGKGGSELIYLFYERAGSRRCQTSPRAD